MLQNLESRFATVESVTKNVQELLEKLLTSPVMQCSPDPIRRQHEILAVSPSHFYTSDSHQENDLQQQPKRGEQHQQQCQGDQPTRQGSKWLSQQPAQISSEHMPPITRVTSQPQFQSKLHESDLHQYQQLQLRQHQQQEQPQPQQQKLREGSQQQQESAGFTLTSADPDVQITGCDNPRQRLDESIRLIKARHCTPGCGGLREREDEEGLENMERKNSVASEHHVRQAFPEEAYGDTTKITHFSSNGHNDLNSHSAFPQEIKLKEKVIKDRLTAGICAESDSSNSSDPKRQGTALVDSNIPAESNCLQICLEQVVASDAKIDAMAERLDQIMTLLEAGSRHEDDCGSHHQTEPKKLIEISSQEPSDAVSDKVLFDLKENIQLNIGASLNMQAVWMVAEISRDVQQTMNNLNQEVLNEQNALISHVLRTVEELQQQCQQQSLKSTASLEELQTGSLAFTEQLKNVKKSLQYLELQIEGLAQTSFKEMASMSDILSTQVDEKLEELSRVIASHHDLMRRELRELGGRFSRSLDDVRHGLEGCKAETNQDIRALSSALERKLIASSEDVCKALSKKLEIIRDEDVKKLEGVRCQVENKVWNTMEIIASRLEKTKLELFSMVEKESQLLRDMIDEPTTDNLGNNQRKNFTFDLYVDNFVHRMAAAQGNQVNASPKGINCVLPTLDTRVYSFPWYIPSPVDTSFQGFVIFTAEGDLDAYLLFGRNPNELGLAPRIGRAMSCHVTVTDLSGEHDDIELEGAIGFGKPWNETEIKTNEKMGLHLGSVSCKDILDQKLHVGYADGSVLLRYSISVS